MVSLKETSEGCKLSPIFGWWWGITKYLGIRLSWKKLEMQLDKDLEEGKAPQAINLVFEEVGFSKIGEISYFAFKSNIDFCLRASWSLLHLGQSFPSFVSKGLWIRTSLFFLNFLHVE